MRWYDWLLYTYFLIGWVLFIYNSDLIFASQSTQSRLRRIAWLIGMCFLWFGWGIFRICISDSVRKLTDARIKAHRNTIYSARLAKYVKDAKSVPPSAEDDSSNGKEV